MIENNIIMFYNDVAEMKYEMKFPDAYISWLLTYLFHKIRRFAQICQTTVDSSLQCTRTISLLRSMPVVSSLNSYT